MKKCLSLGLAVEGKKVLLDGVLAVVLSWKR